MTDVTGFDGLVERVEALERAVDRLCVGFPGDVTRVAVSDLRNPASHYLIKLAKLETAVLEFLATPDMGQIRVREAAMAKLREALERGDVPPGTPAG